MLVKRSVNSFIFSLSLIIALLVIGCDSKDNLKKEYDDKQIIKNWELMDQELCDHIKSAFNASLTSENAYMEVIEHGSSLIKFKDYEDIKCPDMPNLENELKENLKSYKEDLDSHFQDEINKTKKEYVLSWEINDYNKICNVDTYTQ